MYNSEQKEKFISKFAESEYTKTIKRVFDAITVLEEEWNADICTKTSAEIEDQLHRVVGMRSSSQDTTIAILNKYIRWCKETDAPFVNRDSSEIRNIRSNKIKMLMFKDAEHLESTMNHYFAPVFESRMDNICRCYFWLAYVGISAVEAVSVTVDNLDPWNNTLTLNGKTYKLPKESIPVFKFLCSAKIFVIDCGHCDGVSERAGGNLLLRGLAKRGANPSPDVIQNMALRKIKKSGQLLDDNTKISYKNVWLSGMFYRIYCNEQVTGEIDLSELLEAHFKGKDGVLNKTYSAAKRDYSIDYQRWKEAFEL